MFVGEALRGNPESERCVQETRDATTRLGMEAHVRWTGPAADVADLLAAADVLVSPSAHEGLSLAQLEALALRYADRHPDLADLCLIRLSELFPGHSVITVDRQDFRVYRRNKRETIPLICPP